MASFVWYITDTVGANTEFESGHTLAFYGSSFGDAITVDSWNDSTHLESGGADQCASNHVSNTKYLTDTTVSITGGSSETLGAAVPTTGECPLWIRFSHGSAVETSDATFWADDGITSTIGPSGVNFYACEQSSGTWINATGSPSAADLGYQSSATDHDFYLSVTASPSQVGTLTNFRLQIDLTYQ